MSDRRVSHFVVQEKVGEGGMGVVYRALDERLHRVVALKLLRPDRVESPERRLRFLREARAAAAVTHPHIASVYEAGEADGVVYLAMELLQGKSLRSRMEEGPLPPPEAMRIADEIAQGLACAHRAGVVHRDLKPENVLLTADDRG